MRDLLPTRTEWKRAVPSWLRGHVLGFLFGLCRDRRRRWRRLPPTGWKRRPRNMPRNRPGAIEGVAGPEAPTTPPPPPRWCRCFALGIPFTPIAAFDDLGDAGAGHPARAAVDHPAPGNLLGPDRVGYIGNVMLLALNIPMVGVWSACSGFRTTCSFRCCW